MIRFVGLPQVVTFRCAPPNDVCLLSGLLTEVSGALFF